MHDSIKLIGFKRNHNVIDLELMVGGTPYLFWMNIADFINNIHQVKLVVPFIGGHKINIMKDTDVDGDDHFTASIVKPDGTFHSMSERIEEVAKIKITHRVIPGGDEDEMEIYVVKQMDDGSFKTNTVSVKLSELYSAWSFSRGLDQYTKILVSKNDKVSRITITMHERAYEIDSESGGIKALGNRLDGVCYEFNLGDLDQDKYHDGGSFADDEEPIEQDTSPNGDLASLEAKVDELTELVKNQHRVITHMGNTMSILHGDLMRLISHYRPTTPYYPPHQPPATPGFYPQPPATPVYPPHQPPFTPGFYPQPPATPVYPPHQPPATPGFYPQQPKPSFNPYQPPFTPGSYPQQPVMGNCTGMGQGLCRNPVPQQSSPTAGQMADHLTYWGNFANQNYSMGNMVNMGSDSVKFTNSETPTHHTTSNSVLDQMNGLNQRVKAQQQPTATKEEIKDQPNFQSNFPK